MVRVRVIVSKAGAAPGDGDSNRLWGIVEAASIEKNDPQRRTGTAFQMFVRRQTSSLQDRAVIKFRTPVKPEGFGDIVGAAIRIYHIETGGLPGFGIGEDGTEMTNETKAVFGFITDTPSWDAAAVSWTNRIQDDAGGGTMGNWPSNGPNTAVGSVPGDKVVGYIDGLHSADEWKILNFSGSVGDATQIDPEVILPAINIDWGTDYTLVLTWTGVDDDQKRSLFVGTRRESSPIESVPFQTVGDTQGTIIPSWLGGEHGAIYVEADILPEDGWLGLGYRKGSRIKFEQTTGVGSPIDYGEFTVVSFLTDTGQPYYDKHVMIVSYKDASGLPSSLNGDGFGHKVTHISDRYESNTDLDPELILSVAEDPGFNSEEYLAAPPTLLLNTDEDIISYPLFSIEPNTTDTDDFDRYLFGVYDDTISETLKTGPYNINLADYGINNGALSDYDILDGAIETVAKVRVLLDVLDIAKTLEVVIEGFDADEAFITEVISVTGASAVLGTEEYSKITYIGLDTDAANLSDIPEGVTLLDAKHTLSNETNDVIALLPAGVRGPIYASTTDITITSFDLALADPEGSNSNQTITPDKTYSFRVWRQDSDGAARPSAPVVVNADVATPVVTLVGASDVVGEEFVVTFTPPSGFSESWTHVDVAYFLGETGKRVYLRKEIEKPLGVEVEMKFSYPNAIEGAVIEYRFYNDSAVYATAWATLDTNDIAPRTPVPILDIYPRTVELGEEFSIDGRSSSPGAGNRPVLGYRSSSKAQDFTPDGTAPEAYVPHSGISSIRKARIHRGDVGEGFPKAVRAELEVVDGPPAAAVVSDESNFFLSTRAEGDNIRITQGATGILNGDSIYTIKDFLKVQMPASSVTDVAETPDTFTNTGMNFIELGIQPGDWVQVPDLDAGNNDYLFQILSLTTTTLTLDDSTFGVTAETELGYTEFYFCRLVETLPQTGMISYSTISGGYFSYTSSAWVPYTGSVLPTQAEFLIKDNRAVSLRSMLSIGTVVAGVKEVRKQSGSVLKVATTGNFLVDQGYSGIMGSITGISALKDYHTDLTTLRRLLDGQIYVWMDSAEQSVEGLQRILKGTLIGDLTTNHEDDKAVTWSVDFYVRKAVVSRLEEIPRTPLYSWEADTETIERVYLHMVCDDDSEGGRLGNMVSALSVSPYDSTSLSPVLTTIKVYDPIENEYWVPENPILIGTEPSFVDGAWQSGEAAAFTVGAGAPFIEYTGSADIDFVSTGNPDTILDNSGGSWVTRGFQVGDIFTVEGSGLNDGLHIITGFDTDGAPDDTIEVANGTLTAESGQSARILVGKPGKFDVQLKLEPDRTFQLLLDYGVEHVESELYNPLINQRIAIRGLRTK